jgi:hypothetical protein
MTTPTKIDYGTTDVFQKDLKRLLKKFACKALKGEKENEDFNGIKEYLKKL